MLNPLLNLPLSNLNDSQSDQLKRHHCFLLLGCQRYYYEFSVTIELVVVPSKVVVEVVLPEIPFTDSELLCIDWLTVDVLVD